ncbi:MAG TPA: GntR family transcriptional regulator [Mycobacteriales bacterium]|jgi:DNA-binding GntR family transcriptional regulator|nr:GntR family transcriptional regulator [Mycobacteriales bacterium]
MENVRKGDRSAQATTRIRRPSRQVLTDGAYEALKGLIMDHQVGPGERLNIDELARQLDVSATPVREALARLESDGLVTKRPLSGYAVTELLDITSLGNLFEIRHVLEPYTARKAATRATAEDIKALKKVAAAMKTDNLGAAYGQYKGFAAHDTEFHALIARTSGNPMLEQTLSGLHFHWHLYRLHFAAEVGVDTAAEHQAIVTAVADHDPEAAAEAMERHLRQSEERLIEAAKKAT